MDAMRALIVGVCVMACGPGLKGAHGPEYRNPKLHDYAAELSQASRAHDASAIRKLLGDHVTLGGMWFEDVGCMVKFAAPAKISGPGLDEFARCLATLDLAPSSRSDALPDVGILTYGRGLEVEARFLETHEGGWLNWIGYVARRDLQDALPTVSAASLEALRIDGDPQAPLAGPSTFDELPMMKSAYAWLKVCIDGNGAVTGVHVREASSPKAARVFAAAAQTWKFQPFVLRTQPSPVCSMVRMRYPSNPDDKIEVLPLPLPSSTAALTNVPAQVLGKRIGGEMNVAPTDLDKHRIDRAGVERVIAALHYCIDETGRVNHAALIRSSGIATYDRRLLSAVGSWAYKPYLDEGKPVSVCSSVHIVYRQIHRAIPPGAMEFGPNGAISRSGR
jgi:hypothetical protein